MNNIWRDLRYAIRILSKSKLFTVVAVLSLALGIGANTAVFTLLDQVILRLLPVRNPEQLVLLTWKGSHYGNNTGSNALSYPMYRDFRDRNQVFSGVICRYMLELSVGARGQTERAPGELVSGNYFQVLGVGAAVGRTIATDDDVVPGGHPLVVLSYDYWAERFAADPNVVGREIIVNGHTLTIIGVAEKGFGGVELGMPVRMFVPVAMKKEMTPEREAFSLENRRARWANVFGRLKPGISMEQAKASLQPLFHSILEMEVREKEFSGASPYTRQQFLRASIDLLPGSQGHAMLAIMAGKPLQVLMALVGFVLLIACINLAGLLMARASGRRKEIGLRIAAGAGRWQLVRQLLIESLLLSVGGGAVGVLLAVWTDRLLLSYLPADLPVRLSSSPDQRIFAFAFAVSLLTGILFGLVPAFQAVRVDLASALKEEGAAVAGGGQARLRRILVVGQMALSLLLLIGSGLFIRSLVNLRNQDPGFRTANVVAFSVDPRLSGYSTERGRIFFQQLLDKLHALPGVESSSLALVRILDLGEWDSTVTVEGYDAKPGEDMNPFYNAVSPAYFETLGMPILAGRDFSPADTHDAAKVGIVNEKFARHFFSDRNPVGRHFGFGGDPGTKTDIEIVGVVTDAKYVNLRDEIPRQVFVPYQQRSGIPGMTVYVRSRVEPHQMEAAARGAVRELDANLPTFDMRTMEEQLDLSLVFERLVAALATVFAFLATMLAAIGLYAVMAFNVTRRTREIGVRMALGATNASVARMVMNEVLLVLIAGVAIGLPCAFGLTRLVQSQLFGITPNDPLSIGLATAILATIAAASGYVPALRATRIDPIRALHHE